MNETLSELQAEQIARRCEIAALYGTLMQILPPSKRLVAAAHEWTLTHIETMVQDLLVNIPNQLMPKNTYSRDVLMAGGDPQQLTEVVGALQDAIKLHGQTATRIEQFGKGVV